MMGGYKTRESYIDCCILHPLGADSNRNSYCSVMPVSEFIWVKELCSVNIVKVCKQGA